MAGTLEGKVALVTGGSRGIGRAVAEGLAAQGASVVVGYVVNQARAEDTVAAIRSAGGAALAVRADLSQESEAISLFEQAQQVFGAIDILVANAAEIVVKPMTETTAEDFDRVFGVNAKGVFFMLREAARRLRSDGRIVVTSTGGTKLFFPDQALYLGSKGAVEQFVRVLAWELAGRGITVNTVSPGPTETDMMQDRYRDRAAAMTAFNRIGAPKDVADVVVYLASDGARWVTGQNIGAGGGAF